jgi:hypothetical protein
MKKRCEVARENGRWQVSFFPGGGLPPEVRFFERESQALLAVSEWCESERSNGHRIELSLPGINDPPGPLDEHEEAQRQREADEHADQGSVDRQHQAPVDARPEWGAVRQT